MTNITYSDRNANNVSATVQKRKTLFLSDKDPRIINGKKYQNDYYAEIVIVPDAEFQNMIKKQVGQIVDESGNAIDIVEDVPDASAVDAGALVSTLHPPTNLYWDYLGDTTATEYVPNSGSTTINVKVTFDPSIDDIVGEGQILYYADVTNITGSSAAAAAAAGTATTSNGSTTTNSGSTSTASTKFPNVGTITLAQAVTNSSIKLKWKGVKGNLLHYSVKATGANMEKTSPGQTTRIYTSSPDTNVTTGYHYFELNPLAGKHFSGAYTFVVTAQYDLGVSPAGSTFHVTI